MHYLHVLAAVAAVGAPTPADPPKANTLTEQEIADGWLSLFDGETTFGWTAKEFINRKYWDFKVQEGALTLATKDGGGVFVGCDTRFPAFELKGEYRVVDSIVARIDVKVGLVDRAGGPSMTADLKAKPGWGSINAKVEQDAWSLSVDGSFVVDHKNPVAENPQVTHSTATFGRIEFYVPERAGGRLELRSLKLRPLGLKPLFNNNDLTGWKMFDADPKNTMAKYEVTPAGELAVTGGPGDLQTTAKYDNFVLQARAKTRRPGMNSGFFYRCIEGQYQQGYEVQIQNSIKDDDRTKPLDFGTGAIYRRVPARKVVSTDGEWFTLTIIADGPHVSTWVNGYQVVDWTDERPRDPNPRKGLRTEAGHISIQGHGPPMTADIVFQSIKLAELKPAK